MKWIITLLLLLVLQTSIYAQTFVYLPVIMCMNNCDNNSWQIVKYLNEARINYVLNPSAETTSNFSAVGGATVTQSTTFQKYGLYSYRIQAGAGNDGISLTLGTLTNSNHTVSIRVRNLAKGELIAQIGTGQHTFQLVEKIDKQWNLYKAEFSAGETNGQTNLNILASTNMDVYIDGVQVEPGQLTTYIDGSQEGCEWLGSENGSTSRRSAASKLGGEPVDFYEEYGFRVESVKDAGAAPVRLGIDSYAILPGGELNSKKIEPRSFIMRGKFIANTEEELYDNRQALRKEFEALDNQPTPIRFNGGKVQKEILVQYAGGLEGDIPAFYGNQNVEDDDKWANNSLFTENAAIELQAPNPFWYEVGESAALLDTQDSATFNYLAGRLRSTEQWSNLGSVLASTANAIAEDNIYVYLGGSYTQRYEKQTGVFSNMGTGPAGGEVLAWVVAPNGDIIAAGSFTSMGGVANTAGIARWSGSVWNSIGSANGAINDVIYGLDGLLYATGVFTSIGGTAANRIASFDGSVWSALSTGLGSAGSALAVLLNGNIVVGGSFTSPANRIAEWNGSAFSALGVGMDNGIIEDLAIMADGRLIATGTFTAIDTVTFNRIASWNGSTWTVLGSGLNSAGYSLSVAPDNILYVSGSFTSAGGVDLAGKAARWNGYTWYHLDIAFPNALADAFAIHASQNHDPVINQMYDIYVGFDASGTATYAGKVAIENDGSVQAFPKLIFARTGGSEAVIELVTNERTARELLFNYSLLDGEQLTLNLEPTNKSIISNFFGSRLDAVLPNSDFGQWSLLPGSNDVTVFINVNAVLYPAEITAYLLWQDAYDGYD